MMETLLRVVAEHTDRQMPDLLGSTAAAAAHDSTTFGKKRFCLFSLEINQQDVTEPPVCSLKYTVEV